MSLRLKNSLTKHEELFSPRSGPVVTMYTCGPTVYGRPHIGNYSSFLMADLLRRWLEVSDYEVHHVKNITDVGHLVADRDEGEDKVEMEARRIAREHRQSEDVTMEDVLEVARMYTEQFLEDEHALNILPVDDPPHARPRASETIPEMLILIAELIRSGHAYETADGVYFAVQTFSAYGKLSGNTLEQVAPGARIAVKEEKRHPADFALWKKCVGANARHVLRWSSPWGEGFPGWHIECSAMVRKFLGPQIDIHTGGEDNIFPHHECEIAQSECSGPAPFVRMWLHKRRIDMGGEKMSKSIGNVLTLPDVIARGFDPLDLRYLLLSVHYRTQLKFTWKGLEDARKARQRVVEWMEELSRQPARQPIAHMNADSERTQMSELHAWMQNFSDAMDSDLNTSAALAAVFDCMAWSRNQRAWNDATCSELAAFISRIRRTFGCFEATLPSAEIPSEIRRLVLDRERARTQGDFAESDRLRACIQDARYEVRDTPEGPVVKKVRE